MKVSPVEAADSTNNGAAALPLPQYPGTQRFYDATQDLLKQYNTLEFNPAKRPERMSEIQGTLDHLADELVQTPEDRLEALEW